MLVVAVQDTQQKTHLPVFNAAHNVKLVQPSVEISVQCVYQPQQINFFMLQMEPVLKPVLR